MSYFQTSITNLTVKRQKNIFFISYPNWHGDESARINEWFDGVAEEMKIGFLGKAGDEIIRLGGDGARGYGFFDVTSSNGNFISGIFSILGYSGGELIYFRCMPVCMDAVSGMHIPIGRFMEKNRVKTRKEKNTPYCIIDNKAYYIENLYSGQRFKLRRKNYRSLLKFVPVGIIT